VKVCRFCKNEKDDEEFYRNTRTKDGLTSWCKDCMKSRVRKGRQRKQKRKHRFYVPFGGNRLLPVEYSLDQYKGLWLHLYIERWSCLGCGSREDLGAYLGDGRLSASEHSTLDALKSSLANSEIWCGSCRRAGRHHYAGRWRNRQRQALVDSVMADVDLETHAAVTSGRYWERDEEARTTFRLKLLLYNSLRQGLGCQLCGEKDEEVLDFHHVEPATKLKTISGMLHDHDTFENFVRELEKCAVLCANCSRGVHARTTPRRSGLVPLQLSGLVAKLAPSCSDGAVIRF
jgi:hypothetical protein